MADKDPDADAEREARRQERNRIRLAQYLADWGFNDKPVPEWGTR